MKRYVRYFFCIIILFCLGDSQLCAMKKFSLKKAISELCKKFDCLDICEKRDNVVYDLGTLTQEGQGQDEEQDDLENDLKLEDVFEDENIAGKEEAEITRNDLTKEDVDTDEKNVSQELWDDEVDDEIEKDEGIEDDAYSCSEDDEDGMSDEDLKIEEVSKPCFSGVRYVNHFESLGLSFPFSVDVTCILKKADDGIPFVEIKVYKEGTIHSIKTVNRALGWLEISFKRFYREDQKPKKIILTIYSREKLAKENLILSGNIELQDEFETSSDGFL